MLLLGSATHMHGRKHVFYAGVISRLNHHPLGVFIDTTMSDMLDIGLGSSGLFHAICHIEGLLTSINGCTSRSITLDVCHV